MATGAITKILNALPDKFFVYLSYYRAKRTILNLRNPRKFTEKIQWLKVYGKLERFATYADKLTVRPYVEQKIGSQYLIPLLGVWDAFEDIPFEALPTRFVIKVTHGCGYNYVCKDKSKINYGELRALVTGWMSENFYRQEREPQYKLCVPKIICEQYLEDESGGLRDYKFYCSNGIVKMIQVDTDRFVNHKSDLLDIEWNRLDYVSVTTFGSSDLIVERPKNLDALLSIARKLSQSFPFVRVDLYSVNNKIYFGELTFTPGSGLVDLHPASGDIEMGKLIELAAYNTLTTN
jgi:hypothetical protein